MKTRTLILALSTALAAGSLAAPMAMAQVAAPTTTTDAGLRGPSLPGIRLIADVPYGRDPLERFDVYLPIQPVHDAPVIFMVHGGAWARGDKAGVRVVRNKVARWVPEGFILISINYPLLPATNPLQQARDVGKALAVAQRMAASWGGDRQRFILMGHSAGAQLVSMVSAEPALALDHGASRWLGTVALDSAAYNVVEIMRAPHLPLYDRAFGSDPLFWMANSPTWQLSGRIAPFLAVCSLLRQDSCPQAQKFVTRSERLRGDARMLPVPLSHEAIDADLGLPNDYTCAVEDFMRSLDPAVARRLDGGR